MRKLLSTTIAVSILTSLSITSAFADIAGNTLPSFNNGTNVDVTTNGSNAMNVQIQGGQGGVGIANWNTFNVGKDASVNFEFTAHNQTSLNKVSAAGGMSQIYGSLTNSGCAGCGYDATGKVILVNPNGVLFGDGANINLNSFTATTFDANYDKDTNKLSLTRKDGAGDIIVRDGANIYGDKNVTLAASNIKTYAGSKISTSTIPNVGGTDSYGKVKLVTADGVNFTFYNNGAVKEVSDVAASTDKMIIGLNGTIESGHIDIRNASENEGSEINLAGATLKATKAEIGNDGNIWLTANNKIVIDDKSSLETVNGGNIRLLAKNKVSVNDSELSSAGNVNIISVNDDIAFNASKVSSKTATLDAGKTASFQNGSEAYVSTDFTIKGKNNAQVVNSKVSSGSSSYVGNINVEAGELAYVADDSLLTSYNTNITGNDVLIDGSQVWGSESVNITAKTGDITANNSTIQSSNGKSVLTAAGNIKATNVDLKDRKAELYAGKDINASLVNVGNRENGLIAEAEDNVTIETPGTLSVARLVAKNGDMTLTADKIIAGKPYTDETKLPGDPDTDRSYIYVLNGTFTSNTANDSYTVTESGDPVDVSEGYFNQKHHIEYGDGAEKILLVNKRPYTPDVTPDPDPTPEPPVQPTLTTDEDQAQMLNKLPRRPETFNNNTIVNDGRTTFVDVFAAASQIEIVDDEE